jgi:hypothetical protein
MGAATGFSFASVILSYFLIAGGTFLTTLVAGRLGIQNEYLGYLIMAIGAFVGGFFAARASHGSTIIEPALGAILMVASLVALGLAVSSSETRSLILLPSTMKGLGLTAAASAGGGIAGAFVSEKVLGGSAVSSAPWIVYASIAGFGAAVIGTIFGGVLGKGEAGPLYGLVAVCCLLAGLASGASARSRPLLATLFGGAIGVGAFFYLAIMLFVAMFSRGEMATAGVPSEVYVGIAIVAVGAGIVTMLGALIGWAAVGKKAAG